MKKVDNKGFSLVELIVVIVILAILVGITIGGIYTWVNKARKNTDINNANTLTRTLSTLATKPEVVYWAKKSDQTHMAWWSCAKGLNAYGLGETYFIPADDPGAGKFGKYSWNYLFSRYLTQDANAKNYYGKDNAVLSKGVLPYSHVYGGGFFLIITRDGLGTADFHCYALCQFDTKQEIIDILDRYNVTEEERQKFYNEWAYKKKK